MYLVVGLGNPGLKYKSTYHNIGFMTVDAISSKFKVKFAAEKRMFSHVAKVCDGGLEFILAKPDTFMNLSGNAVKELVQKYGVEVERELIVVYDDADLPLGKTRLREEGSAGSHKGMKSVVGALGTTAFKRIRIGIKNNDLEEKDVQLIDLVLSKPCYEDKLVLNDSIGEVANAIIDILKGADIQRIEEKLNRKK